MGPGIVKIHGTSSRNVERRAEAFIDLLALQFFRKYYFWSLAFFRDERHLKSPLGTSIRGGMTSKKRNRYE